MATEQHRRTTFTDVLRLPEFRALFIAQILSQLGDNLAKVAVALLVYSRSHSPFLTSLSLALTFLTWVAVGPILAAFADRYPRRSVMIAADIARAVLVALIAIPGIPLALILVLITLVSLLEPPFQSARSAMMPSLLPGGDDYAVGLGLTSIAMNASITAGYAAGGVAVGLVGARSTIYFDSVTFVFSAITLLSQVKGSTQPAALPRPFFRDLHLGARHVFGDVALVWLATVSALAMAAVITGLSVAVPYAREHGGGSGAVGLLSASTVAGSFLGGLVIGRLIRPRVAQRLMLPMALLAPTTVLLILFNPRPAFAALIFLAASFFDSVSLTANRIFVRRISDEMRGRAFGIAAAIIMGLQGASLLITGRLAESIHPAQAIAVVSFVCLACICAISVPALSRVPDLFGFADMISGDRPGQRFSSFIRRPSMTDQMPSESLEGPVFASRASSQGSPTRVRLLIALLIAGSSALAWLDLPGRSAQLHFHADVITIAALFLVAYSLPLKFTFRGALRTFTPESIPFVLGLFFLTPTQLTVIRLAVLLTVIVFQRGQSLTKLSFNLAKTTFTTQLAIDLFRAFSQPSSGIHAGAWVSALAAETLDTLLAFALFALVVKLATGSAEGVNAASELALMLPISFVSTLLALTDAAALSYDAVNAWAIAIFAVLLGIGLRTYHRLSVSHAALDRLYVVARELGAVGTDPTDLHPALEQLRRVIKADVVDLHTANAAGQMLKVSVFESGDGSEITVLEEPVSSVPGVAPLSQRREHLRSLVQRAWLYPRTEAHEIVVALPIDHSLPAVLCVKLNPANSARFESADVRLAETAAAQLAVAIEKGQLVASLRRAAERDKLTGLANLESLRSFMETTFEGGPGGVLLILDIDRFHEINDTLGREVGDGVLTEVARRLDSSPGQAGLAARVGSDQFALAIPGQASSELARLAALAVKSRTDGSMRFETVNADVRITIGIARAPEHGVSANTLLRRAEMAMTAAKGTSAGIGEWEADYEKDGSRRIQLLAGLRQALAEGSLDVAYQPKLRLTTGEVTGFEALVRWNHPTLGPVSPVEFVPLTEATGLVGALTSHVLRQALATCRQWHDDGKPVGVAVNISPRSLDDPVLVGQVAAMLTASGLAPHWLTLEITESSLMENKERALDVLRQLRMLGVRLSIDDFGTGYSSLNQLRGLPAHEVKIDRSFVDTVDEGGADLAVVRAIVDLCDSMGLTTVAEGVERASQAFALESLGVPIVQGYFYGRPMPAESASTWLAARPTLAVAVDQ